MANLRDIKQRISSVKSTQQITRAMKMVAAAKLRKAQQNLIKTRPYATELRRLVDHLSSRSNLHLNPFFQQRKNGRQCFVIVTSDRGLCGSFNTNLIRMVQNELDERKNDTWCLMTVGKKGYNFFRTHDYPISAKRTDFMNHLTFKDAKQISTYLQKIYLNNTFCNISIVYNEFISAISQEPRIVPFLPITLEKTNDEEREETVIFYEPHPKTLLSEVIPRSLDYQMYRILLESVTAEFAARMTAMETATDNAAKMIKDLQLYYNQARQAAITRELSEIVGGAEALRGHE